MVCTASQPLDWAALGRNRVKRAHFASLGKLLGWLLHFAPGQLIELLGPIAQLERLSQHLIRLKKLVIRQFFALDDMLVEVHLVAIHKGVQKI